MTLLTRPAVFYPAFALGLTTAALTIAKTGRDALFFQGGGVLQLPVATMLIAGASLPLALVFVNVMKRWGARPARVGILLTAALVLASVAPGLQPGMSPVLFATFVFIPAVFALIFASLWLLASDLFDQTPKPEAARVFARLGASSLGGGIAGGFGAKALVMYLQPQWLIFSAALLLLAVAAVIVRTHRLFPAHGLGKPSAAHGSRGLLSVVRQPYARILMAIAMAGALAGLLIDVQFYISATNAAMDARGNANFFANFYIMLNASSLVLQLYATPHIQNRIGIRGGLMVLPFALVGSAGFATAAATALSLSVLRVTEGGLRSSVHRSIWEQAFIPVDPSDRSAVKIAVDGIAARIAEALGALGLYLWVQRIAPDGVMSGPIDTHWMAWFTLITVLLWLRITQRLEADMKQADGPSAPPPECARFPDQCPCTTELGKGVQ